MRDNSLMDIREEYFESDIETMDTEAEICLVQSKDRIAEGTGVEIKTRRGYLFFKRLFDIVFAALALIVLFPVMLIVAIAIKADSKGPVIFKQKRVGKGGKEFTFYKFRSMTQNAEEKKNSLSHLNEKGNIVFKITNDPRVTKVGRFLRRTSIDELPQLLNILKSDMSLVGPRPALPQEVEKYNDYQKQRLLVKGGLTCFWQVSGRSNLDFDQWVDLDVKYINEMSMKTDFKIILKTVGAVVSQDGAA